MRLLASVCSLGLLLCVEGFLLLGHPITTTYEKSRDYYHRFCDVGHPLLLTRMLEKGDFSKAQRLSKVTPDILRGTPSFSGYFTVNKTCGSNLFFWFFPAQRNWEEAPLVLWLQGGPGASSLFGLFEEFGPIFVTKRNVKKRTNTWNIKNNILFIDQPVGTGFSFTDKGCYASSLEDVTRDLYSAVVQFYQLFPSIRGNKFFITGESYAGHYIPALGSFIHNNNDVSETKINLSGMMIGNGLMDVKYQSDYGSYLYQLGLIDDFERKEYNKNLHVLIGQIDKGEWENAFLTNALKFAKNLTMNNHVDQFKFTKNIVKDRKFRDPWVELMNNIKTRRAVHAGGQNFSEFNFDVLLHLANDFAKSVKPMVEELLEHYPIVFYNGQLDIICAYPMTVNFLRHLDWSGAQQYLDTRRQQWCVDEQLAGYFRSAGNLHEVMVRNAGHMVPQDQPLWALRLVNSVTSSPPGNPLRQLNVCGKQ